MGKKKKALTEKEMQDLVDEAKKSGVGDSTIVFRYGGQFPRKYKPEPAIVAYKVVVEPSADPKEIAKILKARKR